jgi:ketosteroid isomerase-like protein
VRITTARTAVANLEQRWLADLADGNRRDLAMILADDYRDIDWRGHPRNKTELMAGLHHPPTSTQRITDLQVRVWGDTAVATGVNHVQSTTRGWSVEVSFTDVFAHVDGHWRAVSSQETLRKRATPQARQSH